MVLLSTLFFMYLLFCTLIFAAYPIFASTPLPLPQFHPSDQFHPPLIPNCWDSWGVSDAAAPIEIAIQVYALYLYLYAVKNNFSQGAEEKYV